MSEGKGKSAEIEPSFSIDDWMNELLPGSDSSGIDRLERSGVPSSSLSDPVQQYMPIKLKENYQVYATNSNIMSGMHMNSTNTSDGQNNLVGGCFSNTSSTVKGSSHNQASCNMVSQFDQRQLLHHRAPAQLIERPNNYSSSARLNAYNLDTGSGMLQQQRPVGHQAHNTLTMRDQESCNVIQQADQTNLEARLQQVSRHVQIQQPLRMQSDIQQSESFALVNRIKSENQPQHFPQGTPQASLESSVQVQMVNSIDWVEQALHQIQQLKRTSVHEVVELYKRALERRNQASDSETVTRCEHVMLFIGKLYKFLQMSRADILCYGKENFYQLINNFRLHLDRIRAKNTLRAQQLQQAGTPQLHQSGNVPQSHGTLPTLPGPSRQQRTTMSSEASPVNSSQVGSSAEASTMNIHRYNSVIRPTQQHSPNRVYQGSRISSPHNDPQIVFKQRSPVMLPHSSAGVAQQINFTAPQQKATSSRNMLVPIESSIIPTTNRRNIAKSAQHSPSEEQHMQNIKYGSPLRHFTGSNKNHFVPSPQNSQNSSSLIEFSKSRTPSNVSASPMAFPSPLNPLTPSSKPADSDKSLSLEEDSGVLRTSRPPAEPPTNQNELVTDQDESSRDKGDAFKRLINVVKKMSSKALSASLRDITAVGSITDRMSGSFFHEEPKIDIVNHLADDTRKGIDWNSELICETGMELRMKRQLDSIGSMIETECHASGIVKRHKKEPNNQLMQEIKEINQKLIEVFVDARTGCDEGTSIVRCSYHPVGLNGNDNLVNTSQQTIPYLVLELIVTDDYPHSPPIIVEKQLSSGESEEGKDIRMKVMSSFSLALRKYSEPLSLQEMAKTWGVCAREVYREFVQQNGGGDFTSTYGKWETCVSC